jgi:hypothetical protein
MDSGTRELVVVLALMVAILIFAVGAVVVFIRQWRREQK